MAKTLLEMKDIVKTFPGVKALSDVNLKVEDGEIHALVGENGAGKSTLMNVLSGIYPYGTYDGKIISSICTVLLSVTVVIASFFIAFWNNDIYEYLRNVFKDGDMSFIVISLFATAILEVIYAINVGIFSIVVGHRANNSRVLISIILGFALYYGLQCVLLAGIAIAGIFDDSIQAMFGDASNTSIGFSTYRTLMLITNLLYLTLCTGLYFGGKKLFAKGVNVE